MVFFVVFFAGFLVAMVKGSSSVKDDLHFRRRRRDEEKEGDGDQHV